MAETGNTARIEAALHQYLRALTLAPARRVAFPDFIFVPIVGEIYLQPGVLWNASQRAEISGQAARRHVGIYQVLLKGPVIGTSVPLKEAADSVIEHFDRHNIAADDIIVRIGSFSGGRSVPWRSPLRNDGGWRQIAVSAPFWCDVFPS